MDSEKTILQFFAGLRGSLLVTFEEALGRLVVRSAEAARQEDRGVHLCWFSLKWRAGVPR